MPRGTVRGQLRNGFVHACDRAPEIRQSTTVSASAEGENVGGRLVRSPPIVNDRLRDPLNHVATCGRPHQVPGSRSVRRLRPAPRRAPARSRAIAQALCPAPMRKQTTSIVNDRARSKPCALLPIPVRAHRDDRRAPSVANPRARRPRRHKAAILPEVFTGAGPPPAMQAVDHGSGDPTRLQNQARHAGGQRATDAHCMTDGRRVGP